MNKKTIISKTVLFVAIVVFVATFKSFFGEENTLVAVTTVTAALMYLGTDLTISPWKNTFKFLALNLFIGIATYIASLNMWVGIPVNLVAMFIIGYVLCYNLKSPMYVPFGLQYLFLLTAPVGIDKLPIRLGSLAFGSVVIMGLQMLANKDKISKSGNKLLIDICEGMVSKVELLKQDKNCDDINKTIHKSIYAVRKIIYDKREQGFYLTEEGRIKLTLSVALEKCNLVLEKTKYCSESVSIFNIIDELLLLVKDELQGENSEKDYRKELKSLLDEYEKKNEDDLVILQILSSIKFISNSLDELRELDEKNKNFIDKINEIPENFKRISLNNRKLIDTSISFRYAIKISTAIALGSFIVDLGNKMGYPVFEEGRWLLFTLLSLINPIYEVSRKKLGERIIGTLIGSVIIVVLFTIFSDVTVRMLIILMAGYISNYLTQYKHTMITTTISALGSVALVGDVKVLTEERIMFVCIGAILAGLINRYYFRYKVSDANISLNKMYKNTVETMIIEIKNLIKGEKSHSIKNCVLLISLIEERLKVNNETVYGEFEDDNLYKKRLLVSSIYELYMEVSKSKLEKNEIASILQNTYELIKYESNSIVEECNEIKQQIKKLNDIEAKIISSNCLEILQQVKVLSM